MSDRYTLRPLGGMENIFASYHECKINTIAFTTWIQSKQYLTVTIWRKALSRLQKTFESLCLTIVRVNGKRRFQHMEDPCVDFQVRALSSSDDWKEAHERMMQVLYATETGPLWKVRILQIPKERIDTEEECNPVCTDWFTSVVVIGFHHSIVDGISRVIILNRLISILNETVVKKGVESEDTVPLQLSMESLLPQGEMQFTWRDYFQIAMDIYRGWFPRRSPVMKRFPPPLDLVESYTKIVPIQFSVSETEAIIATSKLNGTTIHGVLVAAASVAIAYLLDENTTATPLNVSSGHVVNMRRFMPSMLRDSVGLFAHWTDVTLHVSSAVTYSAFWELAKRATREIHNKIEDGSLLQGCKMTNYHLSDDSSVKRSCSSTSSSIEFCTSNIGDCDNLFPPQELDDGVRAARMAISAAMQNVRMPFVHFFYKFRGRFDYNLAYGTNKMTEMSARKYAEMTSTLMKMAGGEEKDWVQIK